VLYAGFPKPTGSIATLNFGEYAVPICNGETRSYANPYSTNNFSKRSGRSQMSAISVIAEKVSGHLLKDSQSRVAHLRTLSQMTAKQGVPSG
jgi:hypothetical protein